MAAAEETLRWSGRGFEFRFPRPTLLMGILNVTPDSFSDGGRYYRPDAAVRRGVELVEAGAELVDVGGESTRPRAAPVPVEEELRRVLPVIRSLAGMIEAPISIDTRKPEVARRAIEAGALIVNDIAANREASPLWPLLAETGAGYVCMHMQGTPATMQVAPRYEDVREEVGRFFGERLDRLGAAGLRPDQVVLDVGIGFGKTLEHNLDLLANLDSYRMFQRPLLLGVSRKSFIGRLLEVELEERMPASLACAVWAVSAGVQIIRTHDIEATRQAVRMVEALRARKA